MNQDVFHIVWSLDRDFNTARLSSHMWSFHAPDMTKVVYPIKPWALKCYPEFEDASNDAFDRSTLYFSASATLGDILETVRLLYCSRQIWFLGFDSTFCQDGTLPMFRCYLQVI